MYDYKFTAVIFFYLEIVVPQVLYYFELEFTYM